MSFSIVFHGSNAAVFADGFSNLLDAPHTIAILPDTLTDPADIQTFQQADVIIGISYHASLPPVKNLKLYHVPGAGYDGIDLSALPGTSHLCNCYGHEQPIAEYVMAAILNRAIPMTHADEQLRQGQWTYWAGGSGIKHQEIAGLTIGLLGFGHIGKAIAKRAKAFEMTVLVANRSPVAASPMVDQSFSLSALNQFWAHADIVVCSLPLSEDTKGLVNQHAFAHMKKSAVILNVGRGPVIDETALYDALHSKKIAGAIIDTWYQYPSQQNPNPLPGQKPFHMLSNIIMTPHMSGWTSGTIKRRQKTIADNINQLLRSAHLVNQIR